MTDIQKPDFEFESKVKHALFRVYWNESVTRMFRIYVDVLGANNLPPEVKHRFREEGFVPLDLGVKLPRAISVQFDDEGVSIFGLSFDSVSWDIRIPWLDVGAIGRVPGPFQGFSRSPRKPQPAKPMEPAQVVNLAERRRARERERLN